MNRHHDQDKSYKGHHLIGAGFTGSEVQAIIAKGEQDSVQAGVGLKDLRAHLKKIIYCMYMCILSTFFIICSLNVLPWEVLNEYSGKRYMNVWMNEWMNEWAKTGLDVINHKIIYK